MVILVCRYLRDLAGHQIRPEPRKEPVEVDDNPKVATLIGPELTDFILPDLIMLAPE